MYLHNFLQSINGTHLNNILIGKNNRKNLEHGDIIMLTSNVKFKFELREVLPDDDEFVAIAEAVMDSVDIAKGAIETADVTQVVAPKKCESRGLSSKLDEDDLTCSVCTELFIEAVTLGCSHTFCKFCIEQWRKNDDVCPICRTKIKGQFPTLIINNLVEKVSIHLYLQICQNQELGKSSNKTRMRNLIPDSTTKIFLKNILIV